MDPRAVLDRVAAEVGGGFVTRELVTPFASVGYAPEPLPPHSAFVSIGSPVSRVWTYAGAAKAHVLVIIDQGRAQHYLNLCVLGLFSITAGPEDFIARLTSRDTWTGAAPFNPKLLRDTTHHVSRALGEHFGRRQSDEEKAIVFETLWRHAQLGPPQGAGNDGDPLPRLHFLSDSHTYRWLEERVRSAAVHTIWGDGRTHIVSEDARQYLDHHEVPVGLLCLGGASVFDASAWQRVRFAADCHMTTDDMPAVPYDAKAALSSPPVMTGRGRAHDAFRDLRGEPLRQLLEEALHRPHAEVLDALLSRVREEHDRSTPLAAYCEPLGRDDYWQSACDQLLDAPEHSLLMANALAHALQLDVDQ